MHSTLCCSGRYLLFPMLSFFRKKTFWINPEFSSVRISWVLWFTIHETTLSAVHKSSVLVARGWVALGGGSVVGVGRRGEPSPQSAGRRRPLHTYCTHTHWGYWRIRQVTGLWASPTDTAPGDLSGIIDIIQPDYNTQRKDSREQCLYLVSLRTITLPRGAPLDFSVLCGWIPVTWAADWRWTNTTQTNRSSRPVQL